MKKAAMIVLVFITTLAVLGTVSFYTFKNMGSEPLQIRPLISTEPAQSDPINTVKININTADASQLASLPGIGTVLAQRIIDYRNENGPFQSPAELLNVPGIGEKKLENILDQITIGGNT